MKVSFEDGNYPKGYNLDHAALTRLDVIHKMQKFVAVKVKFKNKLKFPVSLKNIKKNKALKKLPLIKQSRLSVMPIDSKSWKIILKMGNIT